MPAIKEEAMEESITGYLIYIGNNLIWWKTKQQQNVALSSAEAELEKRCELEIMPVV